MSDAAVAHSVAPFESASELREAHGRLLEAFDSQLGEDASSVGEAAALAHLEPEIRLFLERGAATGIYLEEIKERTSCQVLLDYWVSSLAQAGLQAGSVRLARFDAEHLPNLQQAHCLYVGLEAFRDQDRTYFFGRESDTKALLAQVRDAPLVVVLGASGSGKSSLVMGGVLPALTAEGTLRVVPPFVPGNAVLEHLVEAVLRSRGETDTSPASMASALRENPQSVLPLVGAEAPPALITIDQFEEVFTLSSVEDREALVASLAQLLEAGHRVILTMREEFRSRIVELRALSPYLDKAWYSMRPMDYDELRAAVEKPAALMNLQFQAGIVDDLVKKVLGQPAALPLLQFTLRSLWDKRDRNRITREVYGKTGDPLNALKASADQFYDGLAPQTQIEVRRVLLELVLVDELLEAYRQPVPMSRLLQAGKANTEEVIELLAENDYVRITAGAAAADAIVEVKHESLVRNWPRFVAWIDEKRIERRQRLSLSQAAERWAESGKPTEGLLTGWQLEEAKGYSNLSAVEEEFVQASAKAVERTQWERENALLREAEKTLEQQRRNRRNAAFVGAGAFVVIVLAGLAGLFAWKASRAGRQATELLREAESTRLMANADRLQDADYDASLLVNLEALRATPTLDASAGLLRRFVSHPHLSAFLSHKDMVNSVTFSPDGKRLASASDDNTVSLWDVENRKLQAMLEAHKDEVASVAFSPDGKRLASASRDKSVILWDVDSRKPVATLQGHKHEVDSVTFSPDGKELASASADETVILWDVDSGKPLATLEEHKGGITSVAFSPDGTRLAVASAINLTLWDVDSRKPLATLQGHTSFVMSVAFSPDGQVLASASSDKTVILWDVNNRKPLATLETHQQVLSVAFSPDGKLLASVGFDESPSASSIYAFNQARPTVILWDVDDRKPLASLVGHRDVARSVAFSPDGSLLASASADKSVILWDIASRRPLATLWRQGRAVYSEVHDVAFSPDGNRLASANRDKTVTLWDVASRMPLASLEGHQFGVYRVAFSPDGKMLASASRDRTVILWDLDSRKPLATLKGHRDYLVDIAFSPDGNRLASASEDNTVILWDVASRKPLATLEGHKGNVRSVAFSPDGRMLASASEDKNLILWDVDSHKPLATLRGDKGPALGVAFSPDGKVLASASEKKTVILWDVDSGQPLATLEGHKAAVYGVAFSPDGKRLASASADETVILWDVDSHKPLVTLEGHMGPVESVAFSPDGKRLASASWDTTVILWDLDLDILMAEACRTANRNLTCEEWRNYIGADKPYRETCPGLPGPGRCD